MMRPLMLRRSALLARATRCSSLLSPPHRLGRDALVPAMPFSREMGSDSSSSGDSNDGFASLGLHDRLVATLRDMGLSSPTGIQRKSVPAILARKDVLCTAQTGTGKTLAYMVPVVEQLHRREAALAAEAKRQEMAVAQRPQVLVLLPSRELALQVGDVAKSLAHGVKFASTVVTSGERKSLQQKSLARHLDMVVGTPGRLAKCVAKGDFFVSRVNTVVIDEADTLLDAKMGFRKELDDVLKPVQASAAKRGAPLQIILVAATLRAPLDAVVKKKFGELRLVSDDQIHRTPATLREEFLKTSPENKHSALREALRRFPRSAKTIVFGRTAASCNAADHMLREHGFKSLCLHGDMPTALREASVEAFHRDAGMNILVCTDLAARGLHFDHVKHVVMCDFPQSAVDYVHRAGRAGRAGEEGHVTSLVTRFDAALAHTLEQSKTNRKTIKDLRSDLRSVVEAADDDEREKQVDGGEPPRRKPLSPRRKAMVGHGTKRLRQHKLRRG